LKPGALEKESGEFSLKKYCESFKSLSDVNKRRQFILYTNAKFDSNHTGDVNNFTMIPDNCWDGNVFFNTSSGGGNVYRFEVNDKTPQDGKITKSDYEQFFSRFRLFVCQKNVEEIEQDTVKILQYKTKYIVPKYLDLFRKWHQGKFTNKTIDKVTLNVHIIDIFLSPFIITNRYFPVGQNEKLKLFEKVIKEFDVILINDSFKDFTKNLTNDFNPEEGIEEKLKSYKNQYKIESNAQAEECITRLAKEIKIIDKSVTELKNEVKLKVLQYAFEKPIIVEFNETSEDFIYKIMELHQLGSKIKFILVGQGIQSAKLSRFRIFENVNDLRSNDELYSEVTRTCRLSLQGRKETTLEELIDSCEEICEHVGANEVFQMLEGTFLIGQATESLPSFYINRKVSFQVYKIDAFLDGMFFMKYLAVVKFDRKVKKTQDEIRKCNINVVDVHDYLKSTQISNKPTIISTNEEFSKQLLQDVQKKSDNKSVVYLRISEYNGSIIISVEENQIHCLSRPVNILCADSGVGKTTMLKKLRNDCDYKFWTIYVDLKTHNEFFKKKHDANELLNHLIEGNENSFSKRISDVFRSKRKVYFYLDGLDEVEKCCVDNVLDSVKELSSEGFHVWICSRKNLKTKLEDCSDKVAVDMEEVEEEQQKLYIKNRLKEEYNDEQIENIISKIFNSSDIDNNCQVLGKALHLHIITQIFLDDKKQRQQMTEHAIVFTKMYDLFFRGRFKHNQEKQDSNNSHLSLADVDDILENHELVAVHSVFGEEILKKLNLDMRRAQRVLNQINTNKDILGIVTKVNDAGKAVFEHFTYGEYFAARFFANNFEKARLIREELFSDGRKNLMMILSVILAEDNPLHLAVIYRNLNQIEKFIEDKNVYDKAGRNPLHLATYFEPRCVDHKSCYVQLSEETKYLGNIDIFTKMMKFNHADRDKLFQWNTLEYAFENKSLVWVEIILKTDEYSNNTLSQYIKKYMNNDTSFQFCVAHGCKKLLSSLLEISERNKNVFKLLPLYIIEHIIRYCYFQEDETLHFVIDTFQHFYVDSTNERGETALHLAAMYGKLYAVRMLLDKGASVNVVTKDGKTPWDLAREHGYKRIANFLIENTTGHLTEKLTSLDFVENKNEFLSHLDTSSENVKKIKLLIDQGGIVDTLTKIRQIPLHIAAFNKNVNSAELLTEKGASVNAKDDVTPLHCAAQNGNLKAVEILIEKGASVNTVTKDKVTPLHCAAISGNLETAELLIEKGASVNARARKEVTPLHVTALGRNSKTAKLLIDKGALVDALATGNETPLHWAADCGNAEAAALLIEKGASVNALAKDDVTALHYAAQNCDLKTVAILIEKGAFVNARAKDEVTPLHVAAITGNSKTAELLIEKGASVNALAKDDVAPLHVAAITGNSKTAELLIEKGASVNALAKYNLAPLHYVAQSGNLEIVAILIEKGASVNARAKDEVTPLHVAAITGNSKTAELLIEKGASVNALAKDDVTALHYAAQNCDLKTVAILIEKGAFVNALETGNITPLHYTALTGNSKTAKLLFEKGASLNALTEDKLTPLHYAAMGGNLEVTEFLIENGASVKALAKNDITPLHLAAQRGNSETAKLLIEKGAVLDSPAKDGSTPLDFANQSGNLETTELLVKEVASVNALSTANQF
jgi:ankyrin repeat protein